MTEIERKFLVKNASYRKQAFNKVTIKQGFLNTHPERTVRIRLTNDEGFITIKGKSTTNGLSRFEWEKPICKDEAEQLLELCEESIIDKIRFNVKIGAHVFEVDEFYGDNSGLIVAEVELQSENEVFEKPDWLGEEVTGDAKYYNSQLSKTPFKTWHK